MTDSKFSLIDLEAEMPTGRKQIIKIGQRDRLSERTTLVVDAIVGSHGKKNHEKLAEMTSSFAKAKR